MRARLFVVIACTILVSAHAARADLVAFWRNNLIIPQAVANDPALAGMQSWSLMLTNRDGVFSAAGVRAVLPLGNVFYRHPAGGQWRPRAADVGLNPALAFHTYVSSPQQATGQSVGPSILGGFPEGQIESFGRRMDPVPGTFSIIWGHPEALSWDIPPGTYEIMRATFPLGLAPQIHPQSVAENTAPDRNALVPTTLPEPVVGAIVLLASVLLDRSRRPRGR